ncbi:nuclear transport factor 2 family protein [Sphingomonas solaris]|uniref:Nuclear transport factor 2 family protein n=1 Tax=Alterirhizorhabdus solaris TaxID=2529389 RepID=A0A558RBC8_9SPHN|nr:nuclear transport factor 2 family protein [Sphingomonas solaris]TVV76628.1 nuclear transport factor 2 family protein [Sphingomonas solaris]
MDGMTDLERLLALEEIKLLKARRDRAVDTKDWDTYLALHAPDHESHNDGFDHWKTAEEMITNVRRLLDETRISVHHSHTPEITFESPTSAKGIWAMEDNIFWKQGDEEHWLNGFGFYPESYEKRDGTWVFTRRQLKRTHVRLSPGANART